MTERPRQLDARLRRRGFTLTELLIVMGIVVLIATLAIPAFSLITGARSQDSAQNQLSAILGRARSDAIGLQEVRGVLFYYDEGTNRVAAGIVRARPDAAAAPGFVALDLLPDREHLLLPVGVGVETLASGNTTEKFISYNKTSREGATVVMPYGGVILFDGSGQLVNKQYTFCTALKSGVAAWTPMGRLLLGDAATTGTPSPTPTFVTPLATAGGMSQVGFVLYDGATFTAKGYVNDDKAAGGKSANEAAKETWVDANSLPFLINRYNGTLVRGE